MFDFEVVCCRSLVVSGCNMLSWVSFRKNWSYSYSTSVLTCLNCESHYSLCPYICCSIIALERYEIRRTGLIGRLGNSNYTKSICIYGMCLPMHLHELSINKCWPIPFFIAVNGPCRVSQSEKIELIVIYYFKHICFWMNYVSNSVMFVPIDQTSCWTHQGYHEDPHTYFPVAWIFPKRYVCFSNNISCSFNCTDTKVYCVEKSNIGVVIALWAPIILVGPSPLLFSRI